MKPERSTTSNSTLARATHRLAGKPGQRSVKRWLLSAALLVTSMAHAGLVTTAVDFSAASQSLWGPGGGVGFDYTRSVGISMPFGLGTFNVGYSVAASSGQVSGHVNGGISASFNDVLNAPGATSINLSFLGDGSGGRMDTTLGARAQLTSSVADVGPNFTLNAGRAFTPQLDALVSFSDTEDPVATLPLVNLLAADAGVSMGVTQNNEFRADRIDGFLHYRNRANGASGMEALHLDTNAGTSLGLHLTDAGIYDFWYAGLDLANSFKTSLDLDLNAYARTAIGCGTFGLSECYTSWTVVSPTVYDGASFALDFSRIEQTATAFSIEVLAPNNNVPEPPTLALVGAALLLISRLRPRGGQGARPGSMNPAL